MKRTFTLLLLSLSAATLSAQAPDLAAVISRMSANETAFVKELPRFHPRVETYVQRLQPDKELGTTPAGDSYFLGWLDARHGLNEHMFTTQPNWAHRLLQRGEMVYKLQYDPVGFAQMVVPDNGRFDRQHYAFTYVREEFLGTVRCRLFDVLPRKGRQFEGRIWVEDKTDHLVRFDGHYTHGSYTQRFVHFDSWRSNMGPDLWLPAAIYVEESNMPFGLFHQHLQMKGETRFWGYALGAAHQEQEMATMTVESPGAEDQSAIDHDLSPVESQRIWERKAEDDSLERLEAAGLLASAGAVDKVLATVINNLEVTNNLDVQPDVRCRVMLTTPLESFTVGHTIVLNRGLIDVLPDEASLAMVLAHELGHIILGHRLDTRYAFNDRMLFPDEQSFHAFALRHKPEEEEAADAKALELLSHSPYKDKLGNAGLFLRTLALRAPSLPHLAGAHLGNRLANGSHVERMAALLGGAPQLQVGDVRQVAALPLGARVKLDPWSDRVTLLKSSSVALLSAREKMPFEVTPYMPYLTRVTSPETPRTTLADQASPNSSLPVVARVP